MKTARTNQTARPILVIDVGGCHVKVMTSKGRIKREFESGPDLTAKEMVRKVKALTKDWSYDAISIGYPGPVAGNRPLHEPWNLGEGWKGFDFQKAFGKPTKVVNDALMQALGGYKGGRMLFLGLGTGLGSAMIVDGELEPMELGHLPYRKGKPTRIMPAKPGASAAATTNGGSTSLISSGNSPPRWSRTRC